MTKKTKQLIGSLLILSLLAALIFLFAFTRGPLSFTLDFRLPRLIAFIVVAVSMSLATVTFQTLTHNNLLTPNIIGIDSVYIMFQILSIFFFSPQSLIQSNTVLHFLLNTAGVITFSLILFNLFYKKFPNNIPLMLLFGLVLGILVNSFNNFLQVIMDPDEYSAVLSQSLVSFGQIDNQVLAIAVLSILPICFYLFKNRHELDVLSLGNDYAQNLGIAVQKRQLLYFSLVAALTSIATALVGPVSFLGFLGANVAYTVLGQRRHDAVFIVTSLIIFLFITFGQVIVDHVFQAEVNLGIIIEFIGGLYYLFILLKGKSRQ